MTSYESFAQEPAKAPAAAKPAEPKKVEPAPKKAPESPVADLKKEYKPASPP